MSEATVVAARPPWRILHVVEASSGGVARHVVDLACEQRLMGHEVQVVYSPLRADDRFLADLRDAGVTSVHAIAMQRQPSLSDFGAIRAIRRHIRRHGPFDIVHGHSSKGGALARLASVGIATLRVYTPHAMRTLDPTLAGGPRLVYGFIELALARFCTDLFICTSKQELQHAVSHGIPEAICYVIRNRSSQRPRVSRQEQRASLGIPDDVVVIAFVGRLEPQKAPLRALDIVARLSRTTTVPFQLLVVGDGSLKAEMETRIRDLGLGPYVTLVGNRRGIDYIAAADALLNTSTYDTSPYVISEAAQLGIPVVTTPVGDAADMVSSGETGFVVKEGDTDEMVAALRRFIADSDFRAVLTQTAQSRAGGFDAASMAGQISELYERGLIRKTSARVWR